MENAAGAPAPHQHTPIAAHHPSSATPPAHQQLISRQQQQQQPAHQQQQAQRWSRSKAFDKMEELVREMQDTEQGGVPVRSQKLFLTSIPAAFMGYDLIEWLMMRLEIEESEALNIANQLCQYGYFFPISDSKNLVVKDDSSLYRFQSPYYWPWQNKPPDNVDYAIYLAKRALRNKQRHALEDYEIEAMNNLKKNLANKWDIITAQAEEQVKLSKSMKKADKLVADSQEKAYWRVHRPPPGFLGSLELIPIPNRKDRPKKKTIEDWKREVELLRASVYRTRIKVSQALEGLVTHSNAYAEYDPLLTPPTHPPNPWVAEDTAYWQLNGPLVEVPTEKRVKKWALSMEDLLSDPTGVQEFTNYLRKEKSEENILFWLAVNDLRRSAQSQIIWKIQEIYNEYVKLGSPGEVNIDNQTMDKVLEGMRNNSRFCFDAAQEHVYNLLLKKDCYPRFIRSDYYKNLLANGVQPSQKKRFFGFGPTKKKSTASAPSSSTQGQIGAGLLQQAASSGSGLPCGGGALARRRGSDRSLSGSAHELAVSGVRGAGGGAGGGICGAPEGVGSRVPHSHSQSNLSDIPYRVKKPSIITGASTSEEVCPWDAALPTSPPPLAQRLRKNSTHVDSESSSSDLSVAVAELPEKVQRSCMLMQQHTVDGAGGGKRLSAGLGGGEAPRRASVSVPVTHPSSDNTRRKVASFEEGGAAGTPVTAGKTEETAEKQEGVSEKEDQQDKEHSENQPPKSPACDKKKSPSVAKACSVSATPIISVSQAAEDTQEGSSEEEVQEETGTATPNQQQSETEPPSGTSDEEGPEPIVHPPAATAGDHSETQETTTTAEQLTAGARAPLAEPDGESPASELPPSEIGAESSTEKGGAEETDTAGGVTDAGGEAKANDVCPWEDEGSRKI